MSLDIKITGGRIYDGNGGAPFVGDIGIRDGKIAAIGRITESARRSISADGALVTPGFVDIHTHYDGQATWDADLVPSSTLGVTTAVMGNCGVGFAPCRAEDQDRLIILMEGVEDIPGIVMKEGIPWNWETYPEYLDALDAMPRTIDLLSQMPHCALRVFAMGERGANLEQPTEDDLHRMKALMAEALDAGAIGFSSSRSLNHKTSQGNPIPSKDAPKTELLAIASALKDKNKGVIQLVSDVYDLEGDEFETEFDIIADLARQTGRPTSFTLLQGLSPNGWRNAVDRTAALAAEGANVKFQVGARAVGMMMGLQASTHPFMFHPSYLAIKDLPLDERVRIMSQSDFKHRILSETMLPEWEGKRPIPVLKILNTPEKFAEYAFVLSDPPSYEATTADYLDARAQQAGIPAGEFVYDRLLDDDGRALIYMPAGNYIQRSFDPLAEMIDHPLALPGLSDGGAHYGSICDANFPAFALSFWGRDRTRGRKFPLERLIRMQTRDTAAHVGLSDRGTLEIGKRADVNVIDFENLRMERPHIQHDLPGGGARLMQPTYGFVATVQNGQLTVENDRLTGTRPGRLVRGAR